MRTNKQKFVKFLKSKGFNVTHGRNGKIGSGYFYADLNLIPRHRVTPAKDHNIISKIEVVNYPGADTKKGDLGCVTIGYYGRERKYRRCESRPNDILKKAVCPKSAAEAIKIFKEWETQSWEKVKGWKVIL